MRPLVFISGPFSAPDYFAVIENVRRAIRWGVAALDLGGIPVIPHLSMLFELEEERRRTANFWYDYSLEVLERCDILFLMPGWKRSRGARLERERAEDLKIPIAWDYWSLREHIRN